MHCFSGAYTCNIEHLYGKTLHSCSICFLWDGVIVLKGHRIIGFMWLSAGSQQPTAPGPEKPQTFIPVSHRPPYRCYQYTVNVQQLFSSFYYSCIIWLKIHFDLYFCVHDVHVLSLFSLLKIGDPSMFDTRCVLIFLNSFSYLYKNEIQAMDREAFKGLVSLEQL